MKSEKKPKNLRLKSVNIAMFGYFCLLSVLLILLVDVTFYLVMEATLENQALTRVKSVGEEAAVQTSFSADPERLAIGFSRFREEGINIFLFSAEGEQIMPADIEISQNRVEEFYAHAGELKQGENCYYRASGYANYAACVQYLGGEAKLLVSYSLSFIGDAVGKIQLYLLLISAVVLVLAFIISYNLSQKLTRGLKTMSDTAVLLAKGDYNVSFANADYNEMAQLSDTLNYVRDEVKKSRDFQREILANVTHDLKTPLTMIKAYASMIQEISGDNPEKRNKHLQVIIDETDRLTGLVNDVLSVSKVSSNISQLNKKVFNLTEFLYGIINKFGYLSESGYTLMVDIGSDLYTLADEEKIEQVIYNLLGNAVSYTGEDKTVYISLKKSMDGTRIKLSVRDTGKGISKEELPNIWDRYYRSEENHNRPVKGTGLGLSIVKAVLEAHSFDFGADSEQGKGSVFWVDFPCVPATPE